MAREGRGRDVVGVVGTRKDLRDWEWDDPEPEEVKDVVWSEDEEVEGPTPRQTIEELTFTNKLQVKPATANGGRTGFGDGVGVWDGVVGGVVGGVGGGDGTTSRVFAPRGKSWIIVTEKMATEYSP